MADEEGDVTITVESDKPAEQKGDPVAELKAQYDEIQQQQKQDQEARQAAEARARDAESARAAAEEQAQSARTEASETRHSAIDQALANAKAASEGAQSEYKAAMEAGDWTKASEAQARLADARYDLKNYEYQKQAMEARAAQPQRQQQFGDPVEAYINGIAQRTPNSANWLRGHRDWITDQKKNAKLTSAHWSAVGEGLMVDSPEYFDHVERMIGMKAEPPKPDRTNGGAARRQPAAPVAPVSPSPGGTSGGGTEVRLTKGEAAAATDGTLVWNYSDPSGQNRFKKGDPIGLQEMARRKKQLQDQGQYDKSNYEA